MKASTFTINLLVILFALTSCNKTSNTSGDKPNDKESGDTVFIAAGIGDKWGLIDRNGNWVTPPQFDGIWWDFTYDDMGQFKLNGKTGLIDRHGKIIIPAQYDRAGWFSNSDLIFFANIKSLKDEESALFGFADKKGKNIY